MFSDFSLNYHHLFSRNWRCSKSNYIFVLIFDTEWKGRSRGYSRGRAVNFEKHTISRNEEEFFYNKNKYSPKLFSPREGVGDRYIASPQVRSWLKVVVESLVSMCTINNMTLKLMAVFFLKQVQITYLIFLHIIRMDEVEMW